MSADYFASQALWASAQLARSRAREEELEEALDEAAEEIEAWKRTYAKDMAEMGRRLREAS